MENDEYLTDESVDVPFCCHPVGRAAFFHPNHGVKASCRAIEGIIMVLL